QVEGSSLVADPLCPAAVNVRELRRLYERECCLPRPLVEELARTTTVAQQEWFTARERSDWAHFLPSLRRIISLKRVEASALQEGGTLYDALLEEYEPGMTAQQLTTLFHALRQPLVDLLAAIRASSRQADPSILERSFPIDRQRILGETVAAALGFD